MRSSVAFALFWVNFIVASLNIYFSISVRPASSSSSSSGGRYPYYPYYRYNIKSTNETLLNKNTNYFLKKEFETPKEVRKLLDTNVQKNLSELLVFINIAPFIFIIIFSFSFCVTKNECCSEDYDDGNAICFASCCCACCVSCCCDCQFRGGFHLPSGHYDGGGLLLIIVFIFIIYGIYKAIQACGKNVSRVIASTGLFLVNLALAIMSLLSGTDKFNILIFVFSLFAAISNLLAMILPNFRCCENLSYDYLYDEDEQIEEINSTPQQLLTIQPQNEMPFEEEVYPKPEEVMQSPANQSDIPKYVDTNPGYDNGFVNNDRYSVNSLDAPAPIFLQQDNDYNNQENNSYPKPQ